MSSVERAQRKKDDDLGESCCRSSSSSHHSADGGTTNGGSLHGDGARDLLLVRQSSTASGASAAGANQQQQQQQQGKQRRSRSSPGVLINAGLFSLTVFLALIQFFDPMLPEHHREADLRHHDPVAAGLADFAAGWPQQRAAGADQPLTLESVSRGRERILQLLHEAGVLADLALPEMDRLPLWNTVERLYGDKVVIVGKEECAQFRERVPKEDRILGVAGLFNTGTNLLDNQMRKNIQLPRASLWQVPWGKHRMEEVKWRHTAQGMTQHDKNHVLPVVILRDPFSWLQSMCSHPYAAAWRHGKHHCPNLVPSDGDRDAFRAVPNDSFAVTIRFDKQMVYHYTSLVHLWSEWYRQYLTAKYPVLLIRFEDLVFQPVTVLREIADCVDGKLASPIQYQVKSSKSHGSGTDYVKALIKTADPKLRSHNLTAQDMDFARAHLDPELMKLFHYNFP